LPSASSKAEHSPAADRPRIAALRGAQPASTSMAYSTAQVAPSSIAVVHPSIRHPAAAGVEVHDLESGPRAPVLPRRGHGHRSKGHGIHLPTDITWCSSLHARAYRPGASRRTKHDMRDQPRRDRPRRSRAESAGGLPDFSCQNTMPAADLSIGNAVLADDYLDHVT
jgi:hypothetical protein